MTNYKCTWCNQEVKKQDFDIHSGEHCKREIELIRMNPRTTLTTVGSVSYVKNVPGSGGATNF